MRELRGEMERLRVEREEWEFEAGRERERREIMEEEVRGIERREREARLGEGEGGATVRAGTGSESPGCAWRVPGWCVVSIWPGAIIDVMGVQRKTAS